MSSHVKSVYTRRSSSEQRQQYTAANPAKHACASEGACHRCGFDHHYEHSLPIVALLGLTPDLYPTVFTSTDQLTSITG
jgi:hypothetical protein